MKNLQSLGSLSNVGNPIGIPIPSLNTSTYTLQDNFLNPLAAGSVNGTSATPTGGTRNVTDTNSKISIVNQALSFATGEASNDGVWYSSLSRVAGTTLIALINLSSTSQDMEIGFHNTTSGALRNGIRFRTAANLSVMRSTVAIQVGTYVGTINYKIAVTAKGTGDYVFIKGGAFVYWTLLYILDADSTAIIPAIVNGTTSSSICVIKNFRIPTTTFLPTPTAYDTFTRSNGSLGSTETSGPDSQTTPSLSWTSTLGTWAISTNKATSSALSGGSAFATVSSGKSDIIIDCNLTRSAGVVGTVLRYSDSNNYIIAYHDGTNAKLDKVIGGVTTNVLSAAQAYSANATLRVIASGSSFLLYYNNVKIGGIGTISDAAVQSTTVHGMYTTDTGATFDNFSIFPRGTTNEYSTLDTF